VLVFGTLAVIAGLLLFIFLTGQLTGLLMESANGDSAAYALLHFNEPAIVICFLLLEAILFIKFIPNEEDYSKKRGVGYQEPQKQRKIPIKSLLRIIICCILAVVLILPLLSANIYTLISEDGIKSHFIVDTQEYSWDDVSEYKVDCDDSRGLSVTFTMNDGNAFEVLHGPKSATKEFSDKYDDTLAFLVDIDARLRAKGITKNVTHMETAVAFYQSGEKKLWKYVSVLTGYSEIYPDGDELPVSETVTQ